jgi:hypothetical protein
MPQIQESNNPTELLNLQLQTLERISQIQTNQNNILEGIRVQQEKLLKASLLANEQRDDVNLVEISDFNMPFWALVRILIKIFFASILAGIVIVVCLAILGGVIAGILGAFGVILGKGAGLF